MNAATVVLALGGNLGDVAATFRQALTALSHSGLTGLRCSSFHRTAPVDCTPGTPDFLNAVVVGSWSGTAAELHDATRALEEKFGRPAHHGHNTPRTLDIDLILFGDAIIRTPTLTVPHREAARRRFVLEPLAEIAPELVFPDLNQTVRELLDALPPTAPAESLITVIKIRPHREDHRKQS
ncbi:MAG: 2-amino-4-hydroxy-6-hydroxymethyldihydropteridine diphosphokinase [Victivallales bacterium]|nr:2-amino-4-hydroxy-6-hydroxymethyldihydropteridine diphosphokinase [Victivallales bacterium]